MAFDQDEFNRFLIDNNVVGFFEKPIILVSGRQSYWYANCRDLMNTFELIDKLANFVIEFIKNEDLEFDYVYGVPEGITKLADIINYKLGLSNPKQKLVIGRAKPKEHGSPKDKYFIGNVKEGDKVIVIEDVTTTGGSLLKTLQRLKEANVEIIAAVGLVNRMEKRDDGKSVEQAVNEKGVPYYAISNSLILLPMAKEKNNPSDEALKQVEIGFEKYGLRELKF
ncbi:MAG: phosphoribosyltransferase family protein [Candidatus Woesearchaeota archaeon]